jgi:hypothetical protein
MHKTAAVGNSKSSITMKILAVSLSGLRQEIVGVGSTMEELGPERRLDGWRSHKAHQQVIPV